MQVVRGNRLERGQEIDSHKLTLSPSAQQPTTTPRGMRDIFSQLLWGMIPVLLASLTLT